MLKSDRLVCEKNATKAQPVTNCNLGSINSVYLITKCIYHLGYQSFVGKFCNNSFRRVNPGNQLSAQRTSAQMPFIPNSFVSRVRFIECLDEIFEFLFYIIQTELAN